MMKNSLFRFATLAALFATPVVGLHAASKTFREQLGEKLTTCEYSLEVVMNKVDPATRQKILHEAKGIVIAHQYRVGFIFGGQGGSAVLVCKLPQNGQWGPPVFLEPGGVNFGLQAGAKEINSVYFLMSDDAVRRAYSGRVDFGADASAVAGPKNAEKENFDLFKAPVIVYTSYGGLYAGASMKTGWLQPYDKANHDLYQTPFTAPEIALSTWFKPAPEAQPLVNRINGYETGTIQ